MGVRCAPTPCSPGRAPAATPCLVRDRARVRVRARLRVRVRVRVRVRGHALPPPLDNALLQHELTVLESARLRLGPIWQRDLLVRVRVGGRVRVRGRSRARRRGRGRLRGRGRVRGRGRGRGKGTGRGRGRGRVRVRVRWRRDLRLLLLGEIGGARDLGAISVAELRLRGLASRSG